MIVRSYSEPQYLTAIEGFRESPDLFQTYHGYPSHDMRDESPPPGFIDEPSTPLPIDIGGKVWVAMVIAMVTNIVVTMVIAMVTVAIVIV
jgi:hypothetical protein